KGAMLTHRNLLLNAFYTGQRLACTASDRICIPVPFYHCFGCVIGTLLSVVHGAAMVVPAESFDPLATLQAIQDERCTVVYGLPSPSRQSHLCKASPANSSSAATAS